MDAIFLVSFTDYWGENWPALLPAIVFLVLNPWSILSTIRGASARRERLRLAREDLIDQVEAAVISGIGISRRLVYNFSDSMAARRQIKIEQLYHPVNILREVSGRVHRNPALGEQQRNDIVTAVDRLIAESKSSDGIAMLNTLLDELSRPDYESRKRAERLIKGLVFWTTFDDASLIENLIPIGQTAKLRHVDIRERGSRLIIELRDRWQYLPTQFQGG